MNTYRLVSNVAAPAADRDSLSASRHIKPFIALALAVILPSLGRNPRSSDLHRRHTIGTSDLPPADLSGRRGVVTSSTALGGSLPMFGNLYRGGLNHG